MTNISALTVADLGEQMLLARVQRYCPAEVIGDDAAVLTPSPGYRLVMTTDMLVDGVHFSERTTTSFDIGWRTAAANLSDLAAMGADPLGVTVGLGLPRTFRVEALDQLYEGMVACLQQYGAAIAGGDLCRSEQLTLSMTAVGQVLPHQQILRSTARVGDAIVVTGPHGGSRAGLECLLQPEWGLDLSSEQRAELCRTHQRPEPRLDVVSVLRELFPEQRIAGMDSSDGLADAVLQICRASGVGARLDRTKILIPASLRETASLSKAQAMNWALFGGEDFELVLCLLPVVAQALVQALRQRGCAAAVIGQLVEQEGVELIDACGDGAPETLSLDQGFQHFSQGF